MCDDEVHVDLFHVGQMKCRKTREMLNKNSFPSISIDKFHDISIIDAQRLQCEDDVRQKHFQLINIDISFIDGKMCSNEDDIDILGWRRHFAFGDRDVHTMKLNAKRRRAR